MVLMTSLIRLTAVAAATVLALTACGQGEPSPATDSPSTPGTSVIAAFYPLAWAAEQVLGGDSAVTTLTSPGAEAHDLELSPQQIASLPDADLIIYLEGFQPAVDAAIEQSGATNLLEVGDVVDLLPLPEEGHSHDDEDGHAAEAEDDAHDEDEGHAEHGSDDPHFWQDPMRMALLIDALAERLPVDEATVESAKETLTGLDEAYSTQLADCERREFITTHAAFQYLADRYDLVEIGISGVNPDAEPSPARIAEVHDEAERHGITTIFFETLTSDAVASSIAGDLGLKTAVLDPLEGVTDKSPGTDYPSIMTANLESLVAANECN